MVAHKYAYASIDKYRTNFDSVFVVAGAKAKPEPYHEWLIKNKERYDYATQFDVYYDMKQTMENLKKEREMGIDWTLPVLQENYQQHLMLLKPNPNDYICVGEVKGKIETEEQIRRLPGNLKIHGLAKGKYIAKNRQFESLDTSAWISAAVSKKTECWRNNSSTSMFFGDKGKGMKAQLQYILEQYKDNLEKCNIKKQDVLDNNYNALLRLPIAVYFIPLCKTFGIYDENFK
jgi:hypothetical protein